MLTSRRKIPGVHQIHVPVTGTFNIPGSNYFTKLGKGSNVDWTAGSPPRSDAAKDIIRAAAVL